MTETKQEKGVVTKDKEVEGRYTYTSKCLDGELKKTPFSVTTNEHCLQVEFRQYLDLSPILRYMTPVDTLDHIVEVIVIPFQGNIKVIIEPIIRRESKDVSMNKDDKKLEVKKKMSILKTDKRKATEDEGIFRLEIETPFDFEKLSVNFDENGLNVDVYEKSGEISTRFTESALKQTTHRILEVSGKHEQGSNQVCIIVVAESIRPQQWTWWSLTGNCTIL